MPETALALSSKPRFEAHSQHGQAKEKLTICDVCGEIFNASNDREADHHASAEHRPLLPHRAA